MHACRSMYGHHARKASEGEERACVVCGLWCVVVVLLVVRCDSDVVACRGGEGEGTVVVVNAGKPRACARVLGCAACVLLLTNVRVRSSVVIFVVCLAIVHK